MRQLERTFLHINVADFGVAVEQIEDRSLRGRAVIIAPMQTPRPLVHDMSDEAYRSGVRKGMTLKNALRVCRGVKVLPPRFDLYRRAMQALVDLSRDYSPMIESGDADGHLYIDVTGTHRLFGPPPDIGWKIRNEVRQSLGLDPIWSVAPSKLVAKVASRLVKPVGEYIVDAGEECDFLAPLPLSLLPGLSFHEMRRLQELNIDRIGQLSTLNRHHLMVVFGVRGAFIYELCRGVDKDFIKPEEGKEESVLYEHQFMTDTNDRHVVRAVVKELAGRAAGLLRLRDQVSRRVGIRIDYSDGTTVIRQATEKRGSCHDDVLSRLALLALKRAWSRRIRLRSCTLVCDRLQKRSPQLLLFPECGEQEKKQNKILSAMDMIRGRFGHDAILRSAVQT